MTSEMNSPAAQYEPGCTSSTGCDRSLRCVCVCVFSSCSCQNTFSARLWFFAVKRPFVERLNSENGSPFLDSGPEEVLL